METTELKTDHLLEGSLEWLHHQTTEWTKEVEFWREELTFLYHVLRKKELHGSFPTQRLADLENELVRISTENLNELETTLTKHERRLRSILDTASKSNELDYRHDHKTILFLIQHFVTKIRDFKKSVFEFVKK